MSIFIDMSRTCVYRRVLTSFEVLKQNIHVVEIFGLGGDSMVYWLYEHA